MPKEKPIHKMVDEIFDKAVDNDLINDIVEERNFIKNYLKELLDDDNTWQQVAENKEHRKMFIMNMQVLFMSEMENSVLIELATTKHEDK
jgi:hypothetical protein